MENSANPGLIKPPHIGERNPYDDDADAAPTDIAPDTPKFEPPEPEQTRPQPDSELERVAPHAFGLTPRQRKAALLYVMGKPQGEISRATSYTQSYLSLLLRTPAMREEIDLLQNQILTEDALTELKHLQPKVNETFREVMTRGTLKQKLEVSMWWMEKITGKARQEVQHESGTILAFMELLQRMDGAGEKLTPGPAALAAPRLVEAIDVTPGEPLTQSGGFTDWINREIP